MTTAEIYYLRRRRKKRLIASQLTPGPIVVEDWGDLTAAGATDDYGDLTAAGSQEDWAYATS